MLNFRLVNPSILVDLNCIPELAYIQPDGNALRIGAMTRQRKLERDPQVAAYAPLITEAMPFVAHPQIRNRGTLGGSLAHADPAAELPAVMIALDAAFEVASRTNKRTVHAEDFFLGLFTTALESTELVTGVTVPQVPPRTGFAFQEVSRRHGDYALAGVACALTLDNTGVCRGARLVFLGVGSQPVNARQAVQQLVGTIPDADAIEAAANAADAEIEPGADIHASAEYRRRLAKVLGRRALEAATLRARRETEDAK